MLLKQRPSHISSRAVAPMDSRRIGLWAEWLENVSAHATDSMRGPFVKSRINGLAPRVNPALIPTMSVGFPPTVPATPLVVALIVRPRPDVVRPLEAPGRLLGGYYGVRRWRVKYAAVAGPASG